MVSSAEFDGLGIDGYPRLSLFQDGTVMIFVSADVSNW